MIADVHRALKMDGANPLTVIVPPPCDARQGDCLGTLRPGCRRPALRRRAPLRPRPISISPTRWASSDCFYRLAQVAFIGGSLVPHGGQNPLEPARLGLAIIAGPHMGNFKSVVGEMTRDKAIVNTAGADWLRDDAALLLRDAELRGKLAAAALRHVEKHAGALKHVTEALQPYLA